MWCLEVRSLLLASSVWLVGSTASAQVGARALDGGLLDAAAVHDPVAEAERDGGVPQAPAEPPIDPPERLEPSGQVHLRGLKRTQATTVTDLLPRPSPAIYSDVELTELRRRLDNLGIFDRVTVRRVADGIEIDVREKWTLIPTLDFSRGKTFRDTFLLMGATEYNFLGKGSMLTAIVYHEERGWNGEIGYAQHAYHPGRGAWKAKLEWVNSSYRFDEAVATSWYLRSIGGATSWTSSLLHGRFFTYEIAAFYHYERVDEDEGTYRPPSGHELMGKVIGAWDHYHWTDLSPEGWVLTLTGSSGLLVASDLAQERLGMEAELGFAIPFTRSLSLVARVVGRVSSRGNVNYSGLLGGLEGVRGLDDALYRNWLQGYMNLELRQSFRLWERLALQLVTLSDTAAYRQLDSHGRDAGGGYALSAGVGGRLIPTFLSEIALRVDCVRLLLPYREWFISWGLSQYF